METLFWILVFLFALVAAWRVILMSATFPLPAAPRNGGETAHLKQHLNEIKDMGDPSYKGSFRKIYVCPSVND